MARIHLGQWLTAVVFVTVGLATARVAEAAHLGRSLGVGYSAGYHAPGNCGYSGLTCGCPDIPAAWRVDVWNGYPNEGHIYRRHNRQVGLRNPVGGPGAGPCPTCGF